MRMSASWSRLSLSRPDTSLWRAECAHKSELPSTTSSRPQRAGRRARSCQGVAWQRWSVVNALSDDQPRQPLRATAFGTVGRGEETGVPDRTKKLQWGEECALIYCLTRKAPYKSTGGTRARRGVTATSLTQRRAWEGPCMGQLLSSATFPTDAFLFPLAERRRNAPTLWQRYTDWERGRVKAVSREAGARKREP